MFGKLLLTAAVLLGAYLVIRTRIRRGEVKEALEPPREPLVSPEILKAIAYGLVVVMAAGSLLWLYRDWDAGREIVSVQVINSGTGNITTYLARRGDVAGRGFTTLDGRVVTLADVERMVLAEGR